MNFTFFGCFVRSFVLSFFSGAALRRFARKQFKMKTNKKRATEQKATPNNTQNNPTSDLYARNHKPSQKREKI